MNSCLVLKMVVSYFLEANSELGKQNLKLSQPLMALSQSRVVISLPSRTGIFGDWMCLILCTGKGKYWEDWENFMNPLKGSRLARNRFFFLSVGQEPRPPAVSSCPSRGSRFSCRTPGGGLISPSVLSWGVLAENDSPGL